MGERDAQALAAGPLIGLLTSTEETEAAWVRAGLAWQHLTLAAHISGLAVAPLTAIVENPRTRQAASAHAPAGQHLQMLFRLGKSPGSASPHRTARPHLGRSLTNTELMSPDRPRVHMSPQRPGIPGWPSAFQNRRCLPVPAAGAAG